MKEQCQINSCSASYMFFGQPGGAKPNLATAAFSTVTVSTHAHPAPGLPALEEAFGLFIYERACQINSRSAFLYQFQYSRLKPAQTSIQAGAPRRHLLAKLSVPSPGCTEKRLLLGNVSFKRGRPAAYSALLARCRVYLRIWRIRRARAALVLGERTPESSQRRDSHHRRRSLQISHSHLSQTPERERRKGACACLSLFRTRVPARGSQHQSRG